MAATIDIDPYKIKDILVRYRPKRWRVIQSKRREKTMEGLCHWEKRHLLVPTLKDTPTVFVFFHECGHVRLGHDDSSHRPRYRREYEAERFAITAMRVEGLIIPWWVLNQAKINVWNCIITDESEGGISAIPKHIIRWAESSRDVEEVIPSEYLNGVSSG
jgi:hypothetical protein